MGSQGRGETLLRQWEILKCLPRYGNGMAAVELQKTLHDRGFDVSKRQVLRDLELLSGIFPLICNDKGQPYGWRWGDNAACDIPGISIAEALSLAMTEEAVRPYLPPGLAQVMQPQFALAKKKLQLLGSEHPFNRWQDKIACVSPTMPLLPPDIDHNILNSIQEAVLQEMQVEVAYRRLTADVAEPIRLHPLGLILRGNIMYLVATAYDYEDVRLYALHRMSGVTMLDKHREMPQGFSLVQYLEEGHGHFKSENGLICLEALVSPELGQILLETPLSRDQVIEPFKDGFLLKATVPHTWLLEWWILGQSNNMTVLAPKKIYDVILKSMEDSIALMKKNIISCK